MTSPRRRPLQRDDLDVETTLRRAVDRAPEIELGWSVLRQELRDAGWPSRTPEDDRRQSGSGNGDGPSATPTDNEPPSGIDYNDPAGDLALRLDHLADDLEALQDHWHLVCTSLRAMALIARRHMPVGAPAVPACSVSSCDNYVELTPTGNGYRGMELIAGMWVSRLGARPVCALHRRRFERAVPR